VAGAGIQADLKTFAALGVYGASVVTAVTAQNTIGVAAIFPLAPEAVAAQLEAVAQDLPFRAVKTGMLATGEIVEIVAKKVGQFRLPNLVVDPVMAAHDGTPLLDSQGVEALRRLLLPLATVVTPNLQEAAMLIGHPVRTRDEMEEAARQIASMGPRVVVVKGGHLEREEAVDVVFHDGRVRLLVAPRLEGVAAHGTGCVFASAIAAGLAQGLGVWEAVRRAKELVTQALHHRYMVGRGKALLFVPGQGCA